MMNPKPEEQWVVVTSAHHVPRTMACFRAVDWSVTPYPGDFKQIPGGWSLPSVAGNLASSFPGTSANLAVDARKTELSIS